MTVVVDQPAHTPVVVSRPIAAPVVIEDTTPEGMTIVDGREPGPPGPPGPPGNAPLEYPMAVPSLTWGPVSHPYNGYPTVKCFNTQDEYFQAEVFYPDRDHVGVHMESATAGLMVVGG